MAKNRLINARELKRLYEIDALQAHEHLTEALEQKQLAPEDFSVRELAEAIVGREWVEDMNPRHSGRYHLLEGPDAVSVNHFTNIYGQIVYSKVLNKFEDEQYVFSAQVPTVPSKFPHGERIAGIGAIGNVSEIVEEGMPYPLVGLNEDWIDVGPGRKRGMIIPLTREAVYFDNTASVLREAARIGTWLGFVKEGTIISAIIDEGARATSIHQGGHRYHWRGTSYATFQATTPWINLQATNALVDWTDIEAAWLLLAAILDPNTATPVMVIPKHLVVTPQLLHTAKRIVSATEVRHGPQGSTAAGAVTANSPNPIDNYEIVSSRILPTHLATDTDWFLGDISMAVNFFEQFPLQVIQAPPNSHDEFHRDIVAQWKASYRGAPFVVEPRALVKSTAA